MNDQERCPGTIPTNIVLLCHGISGCNTRKRDQDPIEWLNKQLGPRKAKAKLKEIEAYFDWVRKQEISQTDVHIGFPEP